MKKRNSRKRNLRERGITLIALVVTIIVLLILAGVTLNLALNNNGVMDKAQYASNTWANATKNETTMMAEIDEQIGTLGGGKNEEEKPQEPGVYNADTNEQVEKWDELEAATYDEPNGMPFYVRVIDDRDVVWLGKNIGLFR